MNNIIVVENLTRRQAESIILQDINFTVSAGQVVVIIGPSGAGKTTLLRCIDGLEPRDTGRIVIEGTELNVQTVTHLRREIGMVFQQFNLFPHLTVKDNVILAQRVVKKRPAQTALSRAIELLDKVGLRDKINVYPSTLSGGQQQRVAIARALALDPKIMLFDEPTSALDPEMTKEVLDVIRKLVKEGMTMVIASHEMGFVREVADEVIFLDEGKIIEQGKAERIFYHPTAERTQRFISKILSVRY